MASPPASPRPRTQCPELRQQVLLVPLSRAEGLSTVCPFKGVATYRHCDGDGVNR
ncbi:DUF427 domain-containing protein [Nocardia abscessus]|uniref:DUF427 domain-containing protein n=1 Tax=Nocardia TaxID=1817 RepID=UPI001E28CC40|nr:DUF427 domain-containing protein [Nocardia abscessus]